MTKKYEHLFICSGCNFKYKESTFQKNQESECPKCGEWNHNSSKSEDWIIKIIGKNRKDTFLGDCFRGVITEVASSHNCKKFKSEKLAKKFLSSKPIIRTLLNVQIEKI